jgi:hypothetical protein
MDEEMKNAEQAANEMKNEGGNIFDQLKEMLGDAANDSAGVFDKLKGILEGKEGDPSIFDKAKELFDGKEGEPGMLDQLKEMLDKGETFDEIITIGPLIMMKFVVLTAKPYNVPVTVSMNPIMIDGTGMCGCCRLTLNQDGKKVTKFACVDGPDFNGYEVDFDEAMSRNRMYIPFETRKREETCNLLREAE